jgi:hypothetical protein
MRFDSRAFASALTCSGIGSVADLRRDVVDATDCRVARPAHLVSGSVDVVGRAE